MTRTSLTPGRHAGFVLWALPLAIGVPVSMIWVPHLLLSWCSKQMQDRRRLRELVGDPVTLRETPTYQVEQVQILYQQGQCQKARELANRYASECWAEMERLAGEKRVQSARRALRVAEQLYEKAGLISGQQRVLAKLRELQAEKEENEGDSINNK